MSEPRCSDCPGLQGPGWVMANRIPRRRQETDVGQLPCGLPHPSPGSPLGQVHQFLDRVLSRASCFSHLSSTRNQSQRGAGWVGGWEVTREGKLDRRVEGRKHLLATQHGLPSQLWEARFFFGVGGSQ